MDDTQNAGIAQKVPLALKIAILPPLLVVLFFALLIAAHLLWAITPYLLLASPFVFAGSEIYQRTRK
jgi:hypothetical protein